MAKKLQKEILIRPIISEKSLRLVDEQNQYTFEIPKKVTKQQVLKAVEKKFKVTVLKVRVITIPGKKIVWGSSRKEGRRSDVRKAVVTLKSKDSIDLFKVK